MTSELARNSLATPAAYANQWVGERNPEIRTVDGEYTTATQCWLNFRKPLLEVDFELGLVRQQWVEGAI